MNNVRSFLHSASFRTGRGNSQMDSKVTVVNEETTCVDESEIESNFSQRSSSSEKFTRENVKSFFFAHPSSSSLALPSPWSSSQCQSCSGVSLGPIKSREANAIVASASASISNARSFTSDGQGNETRRTSSMSRRHSWASQADVHHIVVNASSKDLRRRRQHRLKSESFPPSNSASTPSSIALVKPLATNACLTAASIRNCSIHFHLRSPYQR